MKRFLISMAIIWSAVFLGLLFAWWTISSSLTPQQVTDYANKVAQELHIPWTLKFAKVQPKFGADFRIVLKGISAVNRDGVEILNGQSADVRMPWTMFFVRNPGQVNVSVEGVKISDWRLLLSETETWLEARKNDSYQEVTLPPHVAASRFNLRLSRVEGLIDGTTRRLDKLYLLNMNPTKPSAFEMVLPWSVEWRDAAISGTTKVLGEYRISQNKIDLHYYLKNRIQLVRNTVVRTGENSIEGKGFYHPRMGLFSTLTAKDDWLAFIGDLEWTKDHIQLAIPKIAFSHELLLDLLPFNNIRTGSGPYQASGAGGALEFELSEAGRRFEINLKTKSNVRMDRSEGEGRLEMRAEWKDSLKAMAQINFMDQPLFTFNGTSKGASLAWAPSLFSTPTTEADWLYPDVGVWDLLSWFPWEQVTVSPGSRPGYRLERAGKNIKVEGFIPWEAGPRMTLVYPLLSEQVPEWVAEFAGQSIERLFGIIKLDSPVVPGFAFNGGMQVKPGSEVNLKLAWKGPPIALLSRSSCKVLMQDNPDLQPMLNQNYAHQAEVAYNAPEYEIKKWSMRSPDVVWEAKGTWANEPIRCSLSLTETRKKSKPRKHEVQLN